jgi:hypothetical protein
MFSKIARRPKKRTPVYDRVMRRTIIPLDKNKCWLWTGPVNNAGYGLIKEDPDIGDVMVTVHKVSARHKGLDITREINHTCTTKNCVNPDHLVYGSPLDRRHRLEKKYGKNFNKPKEPYKICEWCGGSAHVVWFGRKHGGCYPGMMDKYRHLLNKKKI